MSADRREIERVLRTFIVEELVEEGLYAGGDPLETDAVDSLGLEQLVEFIGEEFGVRVRDEEMVAENFESIAVLAGFVVSKQRGAAA